MGWGNAKMAGCFWDLIFKLCLKHLSLLKNCRFNTEKILKTHFRLFIKLFLNKCADLFGMIFIFSMSKFDNYTKTKLKNLIK